MPDDADYYLTPDKQSGFGVTRDGMGIGLFSTVKGRGQHLLKHWFTPAREGGAGAAWIDHFSGSPDESGNPTRGYLDDLYEPHGMIEFGRAPNWTPGGPDVVFRVKPENTEQYPKNPYHDDGIEFDPGSLNKRASRTSERGLSGVPWADEDERDQMVNDAKGV